jgi:hypothetical protein
MENEEGLPQLREQTVNQVGADVAVQLMLMTLFACVSKTAGDPTSFQRQLQDELLTFVEAATLPSGLGPMEEDVRATARTVISNVFAGAGAIQFVKREN